MSMPPVTDLNDYRRQREQENRTERYWELREVDPKNANCTHFFIYGDSRYAVQSRIDYRKAEVESFGNGEGDFTQPRRHNGLWWSVGEVVVCPDVITEFYK